MVRRVLLWILNIFSSSEKPSEDELIAFGAERERRQQERRARVCEVHTTERLRCISPGKYVCPICLWEPMSVPPVQQMLFPEPGERQSDKLPAALAQAQPGVMLFDYLQKHHTDAGPETRTHRTVRLQGNSPDSDRRL